MNSSSEIDISNLQLNQEFDSISNISTLRSSFKIPNLLDKKSNFSKTTLAERIIEVTQAKHYIPLECYYQLFNLFEK